MIGLDTNVVVRYLTRDDDLQTSQADAVFDTLTRQDRGFVSLVVAVETWWVLRSSYRFGQAECVAAMNALVGAVELAFERDDLVRRALGRAADGADLADALIAMLGSAAGCSETVTFDRGAARSTGMRLL